MQALFGALDYHGCSCGTGGILQSILLRQERDPRTWAAEVRQSRNGVFLLLELFSVPCWGGHLLPNLQLRPNPQTIATVLTGSHIRLHIVDTVFRVSRFGFFPLTLDDNEDILLNVLLVRRKDCQVDSWFDTANTYAEFYPNIFFPVGVVFNYASSDSLANVLFWSVITKFVRHYTASLSWWDVPNRLRRSHTQSSLNSVGDHVGPERVTPSEVCTPIT